MSCSPSRSRITSWWRTASGARCSVPRRHAWRDLRGRAAFLTDQLDENGIVVDIGRADDLGEALKPLNYRNLDDLPPFRAENTTTEFLTRYVYDLLADAARSGGLGRPGAELSSIRVTVAESPSARAWYEAPLR